jgi:CheY-like chemotaxis protein
LWPHEVRTIEIRKDGSIVLPPGGLEMREPIISRPAAPQVQQNEPRTQSDESDWVRDKAARFEQEQQRDKVILAEYQELVDKTNGSGQRGHILIVDTDAWSVTAATRALISAGFAVSVLNDGPSALNFTRSTTIDCILLARDLPSISGIEVVKVLRQREAAKEATRPNARGAGAFHLPVVAFTGNTEPSDLQLYMETGFDGCVSKPLDVSALLNTMAAAVPVPAPQQQQQHANRNTRGGEDSFTLPTLTTNQSQSHSSAPAKAWSTPTAVMPLQFGGGGGGESFMIDDHVNRINSTSGVNRDIRSTSIQTERERKSSYEEGGGQSIDEVQLMQQAGNTGLRGARAMAQARRGGGGGSVGGTNISSSDSITFCHTSSTS